MRRLFVSCLIILMAILWFGIPGSKCLASVVYSGDLSSDTNYHISSGNSVSFDFGGFANESLSFSTVNVSNGFVLSSDVYVQGNTSVSIGRISDLTSDVRKFSPGNSIDSAVSWNSTAGVLHGLLSPNIGDDQRRGPFLDNELGYMAIRFQSHANTEHFGWVSYLATQTNETDSSGRITGWAYESNTSQSLNAAAVPEPSSMILLLVGSVGMGLVRRRS